MAVVPATVQTAVLAETTTALVGRPTEMKLPCRFQWVQVEAVAVQAADNLQGQVVEPGETVAGRFG